MLPLHAHAVFTPFILMNPSVLISRIFMFNLQNGGPAEKVPEKCQFFNVPQLAWIPPFDYLPAMPHQEHNLETAYALTDDQIQGYRRDGHVLIKGLASRDEVDAYAPSIREALRWEATRKESEGRPGGYASYFIQITNLWRLDDNVRRFVFAQRFARVAAELMGVKGVRLYHDQALFKQKGGKATPWHQDQFYWPLDTLHTITMWMPLIDLTKKMGTMIFASGSHHHGPLASISISEESDRLYDRLVTDQGYPTQSYDLRAGDATFHSGWTAHAAHANQGDRDREVMTVIYYADGTRILEPDNDFRKVDLATFHPDQKPGEKAASALNPLLYTAG